VSLIPGPGAGVLIAPPSREDDIHNLSIVKSFFRYGTCSTNLNPPYPPFSKGGKLAEFL